ncbi:hypothetical protein [Enterovirga sp.]|uniref:hypothetical protein n=1 Tax=Enterovirga sp. TaxID=2026350 RepID=UPI002BB3A159|nr:hypothetical protein [Enterovirga sp.]HMO30845.1 hypothetical protein [Enterovirga sp.]
MKHPKLRGIQDLIPFLQILDQARISYTINRSRDDSIYLTITTLGRRIELDFFQDHIEYSWFDGSESVHDDQAWLYATLEDFVRE